MIITGQMDLMHLRVKMEIASRDLNNNYMASNLHSKSAQ